MLHTTLDESSHRHALISTPSQHLHPSHVHTSTLSHTLLLQVAAGEEEEVEASTAGEKEGTDHEAPPPPVPQEEGPLGGEQSDMSAAALTGIVLLLP